MRLSYTLFIALVAKFSTAIPSGDGTNQELVLKLEKLEQKLVTVQESLEHQLQTLRLEAEMERLRQDKEIQDLRQAMEVAQANLQSTSEELNSLETQLINFFSNVRNTQNDKSPGYDNSTLEVKDESVLRAALKSEHLPNSEVPSKDSEGTPIAATLTINASGGVNYIRWGRTVCPSTANILYRGYAAGKKRHTSYSFAGSEYICLHSNPIFGDVTSSNRALSNLAGVEYDFFADDPFSKENIGGQNLAGNDMPCTVCQVPIKSQQLMIPGRKNCPAGWTREYWGYLVSSRFSTYGSSYICLDQAPEGVTGSAVRTNPQLVNTVEAECQGLPCPPYVAGYEISCAVCSK